ncbi:MAG: hypothetical protein WC600_12735 [Desulfobaccales bacterium]
MKNLSLLLISLILSLIILEFSLSKLLPRFNPSSQFAFYYNPDGVALGPKSFRGHQADNSGDFHVTISINKYGFRDIKDFSTSTYHDIFVVGDSFSFGDGVEENERFSNLIESKLRIPVFNISIPGNFNDYEKYLKYAQANEAKIKNIIIGVCVENDLWDYSSNNEKQNPYKISEKRASILVDIKEYLTKHSTTYFTIAWIVKHNVYLRNLFIKLGLIYDIPEVLNKSYFNESILNSSALKLKQISNGFKTIVLIIPSRSLWLGDNKEIESAVHNEFVRLVRNQGLDVIDMRPILEASGNPLQYHFPNNGHWNIQGHALAAEAITVRIKQTGLGRHNP